MKASVQIVVSITNCVGYIERNLILIIPFVLVHILLQPYLSTVFFLRCFGPRLVWTHRTMCGRPGGTENCYRWIPLSIPRYPWIRTKAAQMWKRTQTYLGIAEAVKHDTCTECVFIWTYSICSFKFIRNYAIVMLNICIPCISTANAAAFIGTLANLVASNLICLFSFSFCLPSFPFHYVHPSEFNLKLFVSIIGSLMF